MKTVAHISGLRVEEIGSDLFERLLCIFPDGKYTPKSFRLHLPLDDPRTRAVVSELASAGMTMYPDSPAPTEKGKYYEFFLRREYDRTDYEAEEYLWLTPSNYYDGGFASNSPDDPSIVLGTRDLRKKWDFASIVHGVLIPDRVKKLFESSGLRGVTFRPTYLEDDESGDRIRVPWGGKYGEPWWQLASTITLPAYAPSMKVADRFGTPLPRGTEGYVLLTEPPYRGVELHYVRSEIEQVPFDIAQSLEWTGPDPRFRNLVVSKRFYEFCVKNRLKCDYVPVRLDPG